MTDEERKAKTERIRKKMEESGLLNRIKEMREGKKTKVQKKIIPRMAMPL